jgi:hypothetical protein
LEILIFVVIVALAAGYLVRTLWKSLRNQTPSCGGCNACPAAGRTEEQETPGFSKGGCDEDSISKAERNRS